MIYIFIAIICCLFIVSGYYNVKFGLTILRVEDAIEESLDQLDKKYLILSKILEKPIFFDSIEVRQTVDEIRSTQELLLYIANRLTEIEENKVEKDS